MHLVVSADIASSAPLGIRDKPHSSSTRSAIVGIAVGGFVFLGLILILCHLGLRAGKHKGNSSKVSRASRFRSGRTRLDQASLDQLEGQAGATGAGAPRRLRRFRRQAAIINLDSTAATVTPSITTGATVPPTQGSRSRTSNTARRSSAAASANFQVVVERLDDEGGVALLTRRLEEEAQRSRARRCEALYEAAVARPGFFVRVASTDEDVARRESQIRSQRRAASSPSSPLSASAWRVELNERRANSSRGVVRRVEGGVDQEVGEGSGGRPSVIKGQATANAVALPCRAATAAGSSSGSRRLFSRISVPVPAYQPVATCSPPLGAPGEEPLIPAGFEPLTRSSTMLPTSPPPAYASVDCLPVLEQVEVEGPMSRSW